jgi:hypothetical protein
MMHLLVVTKFQGWTTGLLFSFFLGLLKCASYFHLTETMMAFKFDFADKYLHSIDAELQRELSEDLSILIIMKVLPSGHHYQSTVSTLIRILPLHITQEQQ